MKIISKLSFAKHAKKTLDFLEEEENFSSET